MTRRPVAEATTLGQALSVDSGGSVDELRQRLGTWLGADRAVSEEALTAAIVHPTYARRLTAARGFPEAVKWLLARPPHLPPSAARMAGVREQPEDHSAGALAQRLAGSMLRWSTSGFLVVDAPTRQRRWAACQVCPHLSDPPRKGVYRLVQLVKPEAKVCDRCGCVAWAKVRMPHESCPEAHLADPTQTRWGEPRRLDAIEDEHIILADSTN